MPSNQISRGVRIPQRLQRVRRGFRRQLGTYKTTYLASVNGTPRAADGYWWVHDKIGVDENGFVTYGAAYKLSMLAGAAISARPNTRVDTITRNGITYITGSAPEELRNMGVNLHQTNPLDPSARFKLIEDLSNLQTFPDLSGNSGTVRVWPCIYRKSDGAYAKYPGEKNVDILTGYTPSTDKQRIICVWIDEATNTATITASSELDRDTDLKLDAATSMTYINECASAAPVGSVGSWSYIIYDDTTSITRKNVFYDLRGIVFARSAAANAGTAIATKTADYTVTANDKTILVDASSGPVTITLLDAATVTGFKYIIKKIDATANTVTMATTSSQTIDGLTTRVISAQWTSRTVQSDGSNWFRH